MDKKSSSSSEEANFWEHEFTSRTGTVFGMSGYNSVNFWENGKVEYCNKNKCLKSLSSIIFQHSQHNT